MKPFATRDLFDRSFNVRGRRVHLVADPATQRWVIGTPAMRRLLACCDGETEVPDAAERAAVTPAEAQTAIDALLAAGLLFASSAEQRRAAMPLVHDTEIAALHLEITNKCNLRCSHCYLNSGAHKPHELAIQELLDTIDHFEPGSGKKVCITGGEPLLHPQFFELLEYVAVRRGLQADVYTNAVLIDDSPAERMAAIIQASTFPIHLQISLEGSDPDQNDRVRGKGVFERVGQAVNRLLRLGLGPNVVLFVCLTRDNVYQVQSLIEMAQVLELGAIKFSQWQKQGRGSGVSWEEKSPSFEEWVTCGHLLLEVPQYPTSVLGNFWGDLKNDGPLGFSLDGRLFPKFACHLKIAPRIDCEGNVWPCQVFVDHEFAVGNVRQASLAQVLRSPAYEILLDAFRERTERLTECTVCEWKAFCGGGCPGFAYAEHGTIDRPDFFCSVRKYWFEQYVVGAIDRFKAQGCLPPLLPPTERAPAELS